MELHPPGGIIRHDALLWSLRVNQRGYIHQLTEVQDILVENGELRVKPTVGPFTRKWFPVLQDQVQNLQDGRHQTSSGNPSASGTGNQIKPGCIMWWSVRPCAYHRQTVGVNWSAGTYRPLSALWHAFNPRVFGILSSPA